jgi:hypothetical protein
MLVSCRPSTPTYKLQAKISCRACIHTLPHALRLRSSPSSWCGLRCCHVPYGFGPYLPTEVGSSATTCPMALDLTSRLRWALALPCVLWLWTSPPAWGGLGRYHVPYGSEPHLPAEAGSNAAKCPMALDLASRLRWAPALPHIPRLRVISHNRLSAGRMGHVSRITFYLSYLCKSAHLSDPGWALEPPRGPGGPVVDIF